MAQPEASEPTPGDESPRGDASPGGPDHAGVPDSAATTVPATEWSETRESAVRVTTVELFFDLVFVFTITQLTGVLAAHTTIVSLVQVLLLMGIVWWMYAGYAWLTNAVVPSNTVRRGLLLVGMAGFLTMALAIPGAFHGTGWAFGLGYFVVNLVHSGLFLLSAGPGATRAMRGLGPLNMLTATLVLVGGIVETPWRYALWALALTVEIATPYMTRIGGFTVAAGHFVERHGLVIIIALGESVVAIGVGAEGLHLDVGVLAVAISGLVVAYFLYWTYFGGDEIRAEHALDGIADPTRRARAALHAFGYAHYPMLIGIIAVAAGVKKAIGHAYGHVSLAQALALGGGVALFLAGDLLFRRILHIGRPGYRLVALFGALASVPLGLVLAAGQILLLMVVLAVPLSVEGIRELRASSIDISIWRR
jgi:low temperature requirement protein LtrA